MIKVFLLISMCILFCNISWAISTDLKKKYPFVVLNDDHGILNEADIWFFMHNGEDAIVEYGKNYLDNLYWQCFQRNRIEIILHEMSEPQTEFSGQDNLANFEIIAYDDSNKYLIENSYQLGKNSIVEFKKIFNRLDDIMNHQQYVCIGGRGTDRVSYFTNYQNQTIKHRLWELVSLKTKKGCYAYYKSGCEIYGKEFRTLFHLVTINV